MRYPLIALLLLGLSGCALFSTPGRVTDGSISSEAGAVYGRATQTDGKSCPSVLGMGSQTMGGFTATCKLGADGSVEQSIVMTAPDPNPALTTAYNGINQQLTTIGTILQQLMATAAAAAVKPIAPVP